MRKFSPDRPRSSRPRRGLRHALIAALLLLASGPAHAADGAAEEAAGAEGKTAAERLKALCMLDSSSNPAYCECGARVSGENLAPRDLEIMAFAMERTVWGGSDDIVGEAREVFGLTEGEAILAWRNIAAAGLKSSEACRDLR